MENASKALLIAGEMLIAVMILSLAAYLYASFSQQARETARINAEQQIIQFNTQFTKYDSYRDEDNNSTITIYDVRNIINTARNNNQFYEGEEDKQVTVNINVQTNAQDIGSIPNCQDDATDERLSELLVKDIELIERRGIDAEGNVIGLPHYGCDVTIDDNTGRVSIVTLTREATN